MKLLWFTGLAGDAHHKTTQLEMSNELRQRGHEVTFVVTSKLG